MNRHTPRRIRRDHGFGAGRVSRGAAERLGGRRAEAGATTDDTLTGGGRGRRDTLRRPGGWARRTCFDRRGHRRRGRGSSGGRDGTSGTGRQPYARASPSGSKGGEDREKGGEWENAEQKGERDRGGGGGNRIRREGVEEETNGAAEAKTFMTGGS